MTVCDENQYAKILEGTRNRGNKGVAHFQWTETTNYCSSLDAMERQLAWTGSSLDFLDQDLVPHGHSTNPKPGRIFLLPFLEED